MTSPANAGVGQTTFPWWLILLEGIFAAIFGILLLLARRRDHTLGTRPEANFAEHPF
jgi:hypothetical protein